MGSKWFWNIVAGLALTLPPAAGYQAPVRSCAVPAASQLGTFDAEGEWAGAFAPLRFAPTGAGTYHGQEFGAESATGPAYLIAPRTLLWTYTWKSGAVSGCYRMDISADGQSAAGWFRETMRDGRPSSTGWDVTWRRTSSGPPKSCAAPAASQLGTFNVAGDWAGAFGGLKISPAGPGTYQVQESGAENASGPAYLIAPRTILWTYTWKNGRVSGCYRMTVSADGQSALGWFMETVRDGRPVTSAAADVSWRRLATAPAEAPARTGAAAAASGGAQGGRSCSAPAAHELGSLNVAGDWAGAFGGLKISPAGPGTYQVQESGAENASGPAYLIAPRTILWTYTWRNGRVSGCYRMTVAADGQSALGWFMETVRDGRPVTSAAADVSWRRLATAPAEAPARTGAAAAASGGAQGGRSCSAPAAHELGSLNVAGDWAGAFGGLKISPTGPGTYHVQENGSENALGPAYLIAPRTILWTYTWKNGRVSGCYRMTVSDDGQSAAGWFRETVRDGQPSSSGGDVAWRRLTASIPDNRRIGNMAGGGQSGGGSLTIQAAVRRVKQGEVVRIPVSILNASQVTNANFTILYHPDIARPEGNPVRGAFVSNALFSANTGEAGVIRAGFSQTSGTSGSGVIAELVFRAVGPPRSRTELTVQVSKLNDQGGANLNAARIDGAIEIEAAAPVQTGGDCDGDGRLTEADALCALRMSVRLMPENMGLDMDSDRQVTSRDSTIILQKAIGK